MTSRAVRGARDDEGRYDSDVVWEPGSRGFRPAGELWKAVPKDLVVSGRTFISSGSGSQRHGPRQ